MIMWKRISRRSFDEWDLDKLTTLFSEYLFDETLLTDSYRLFKRFLFCWMVKGNNFKDIVSLIDLQIQKIDGKDRGEESCNQSVCYTAFNSLYDLFYSKDCNNLLPAKFCIDTILVKNMGMDS